MVKSRWGKVPVATREPGRDREKGRMGSTAGLSKSRIMSGLQCEKKLWLETHRKDLLKHSARTEAVFERLPRRRDGLPRVP